MLDLKCKVVELYPWEEARKQSFSSTSYNMDGEYDFLFLVPAAKLQGNIIKRVWREWFGKKPQNENFYYGAIDKYPVKRPHEFKKGDLVLLTVDLTKLQTAYTKI